MARAVRHGIQPSEYKALTPGDYMQLLRRLEKAQADRDAALYGFVGKLTGEALKALTRNATSNAQAILKGLGQLARSL